MHIDLEKAKEEFIKYTEKYDLTNKRVKGKQEHSLRVMEISKEIAQKLNLKEEDIELATLIGLLHDIARFEQYKQYETFKDSQSFDHGDYALIILETEIRKFIETNQYDDIIKKAIKNHNKYKIEDGLSERELLFAKIIRDADKLDIFYESAYIFWKGEEFKVEESRISSDTLNKFKKLKQIKKQSNGQIQPIDEIILLIAFIFDLNFEVSFEIIKKEDYINIILNRYNIKDEISKKSLEEVRNIANDYIINKINN